MLEYTESSALSLGVELELQLLKARDGELSRGATDLIAVLHRQKSLQDRIKPEITESMVELNTGIHTHHDSLVAELRELRDALCEAGDKLNIAIAGGGAHPFSVWKDRRIYPTERFLHTSKLYGYLAKQFTVFGQHVHVGCPTGDAAIALTQRLAKYIPYFIALSAASPYSQGEDTAFETSRLHAVAVFPLSGHMPRLADWRAFNEYFDEMQGYGIVGSMKDFYWDIRPKPEFGTVEVRIFDTPLTVEMAAALAALVQTLSSRLMRQTDPLPGVATYRVYGYNRFQACRFGYDAMLIDPQTKESIHLGESLSSLLQSLLPEAAQLGNAKPMMYLQELVAKRQNGASWMRQVHAQTASLEETMRLQASLFRLSSDTEETLATSPAPRALPTLQPVPVPTPQPARDALA
jgi:glutamate---cysteine ligase / carboxylate-amine ligase